MSKKYEGRFRASLSQSAVYQSQHRTNFVGDVRRVGGKFAINVGNTGGLLLGLFEFLNDSYAAVMMSNDAYQAYLGITSKSFLKMVKAIWKNKYIAMDTRHLMIARIVNLTSGSKFDSWRLEVSINDSKSAKIITDYAMKDGMRKRNDVLEAEALALRTKDATTGKHNMKKVEAYELWLASIR